MKTWKISFWITLLLLVATNLFWIYQVIDTAVGHGYYQVSCEKYKSNSDILEGTLNSFDNTDELIVFLGNKEIKYETINKADNENYIIIGSIEILFLDNGQIITRNEK